MLAHVQVRKAAAVQIGIEAACAKTSRPAIGRATCREGANGNIAEDLSSRRSAPCADCGSA
jgi:hypothetical protein